MVDVLSRGDWGATAPLGATLRLPLAGVHVHHSVTIADDDLSYHATDDVAADMREIERVGVERFGRFPYSYCGHTSGWVGEGAGLTVGAHTQGWNSTTFGFCLIGNYDEQQVSDAQVQAFIEWRRWLVAQGWLLADHWVEPHRARKATACPGANTMARWGELTAWPPPSEPPPSPPAVTNESGDPRMDGIFHQGLLHIFSVRDDGALIERFGPIDDPTGSAEVMPPGWCRTGAEARVKVVDPAPGTDAGGYAVAALRGQGDICNVAYWTGDRWVLRGW